MLKAHVTIYSRPDCHLCDEAKEAIEAANCAATFDLEVVNIETDADLLRRYRYDIPVVTINGQEAFKHRVDSQQFRKAIARHIRCLRLTK